MNVSSWLKDAIRTRSSLKTSPLSRLDAELILAHALGQTRPYLAAHPEQVLSEAQTNFANTCKARRQKHEPMAYILGYKEFRSRRYSVTPATLVPRPETESLVDFIKAYFTSSLIAPKTVLDLGTGSGCIAISLALELPEATSVSPHIFATDISPDAILCAQSNVHALHAPNISLIVSDFFSAAPLKSQRFDLIVANLPYIDPAWDWLGPELEFEPKTALYAANHGLATIETLLRRAPKHLNSGALLVIECDRSQKPKLKAYAKKLKVYTPIPVTDYAKNAALCLAWCYLPQNSSV